MLDKPKDFTNNLTGILDYSDSYDVQFDDNFNSCGDKDLQAIYEDNPSLVELNGDLVDSVNYEMREDGQLYSCEDGEFNGSLLELTEAEQQQAVSEVILNQGSVTICFQVDFATNDIQLAFAVQTYTFIGFSDGGYPIIRLDHQMEYQEIEEPEEVYDTNKIIENNIDNIEFFVQGSEPEISEIEFIGTPATAIHWANDFNQVAEKQTAVVDEEVVNIAKPSSVISYDITQNLVIHNKIAAPQINLIKDTLSTPEYINEDSDNDNICIEYFEIAVESQVNDIVVDVKYDDEPGIAVVENQFKKLKPEVEFKVPPVTAVPSIDVIESKVIVPNVILVNKIKPVKDTNQPKAKKAHMPSRQIQTDTKQIIKNEYSIIESVVAETIQFKTKPEVQFKLKPQVQPVETVSEIVAGGRLADNLEPLKLEQPNIKQTLIYSQDVPRDSINYKPKAAKSLGFFEHLVFKHEYPQNNTHFNNSDIIINFNHLPKNNKKHYLQTRVGV